MTFKRNVTQSFLFNSYSQTYLIFNVVFRLFYVIRFISSTSFDLRSLNDSNRYETRTYLSNGPHLCCFLPPICCLPCLLAVYFILTFWPFHVSWHFIFNIQTQFFSNTFTSAEYFTIWHINCKTTIWDLMSKAIN